MKKALFAIVFSLAITLNYGQGLDSVFVEKIPVSPQAIAEDPNLNSNSVTYRVFVSMKPGYAISNVVGLFANPLLITTTTQFYNNPDGDVQPLFRPLPGMDEALYYDSWITIGQYGHRTVASQLIPLAEDINDGKQDGIVLGAVHNVTMVDPGTVFDNMWGYEMGQSADFGTPGYDPENVTWYAAGGVSGIGPSNSVCIGQFTTDGVFSMELALSLRPPSFRTAELYVVREIVPMPGMRLILSNDLIYPPNKQPTVQMTAPADGSLFKLGERVTLTATASDSDGTIKNVTFIVNNERSATITQPPYSFNRTFDRRGAIPIYAVTIDNRYGRDTSEVITIFTSQPPNVSIVSPINGTTYELGQQVPLGATAASTEGNITRVEFYINNQLVATRTQAPYTANWTANVAGLKEITAKAFDDLNGVATSAAVAITVSNPENNLPIVNITSPNNGDIFTAGEPFTIQAGVTDPDPGDRIIKVEFFSNGNKIGESLTAPFNFQWTSQIGGSKILTARAFDNRGGTAVSPGISIIHNILPFVVITSPTSGSVLNEDIDFPILATATDRDEGTITKVELLVDDVITGEFSLLSGNDFSLTRKLSPGNKVLKAVATDNYGGKFTSEPVNITVNPRVNVELIPSTVNKSFWVYPNPADDVVNIHFNKNFTGGKFTCQVFDAMGRIMIYRVIEFTIGENVSKLDISQLPAGFYLVKIGTEDGLLSGTVRIIKRDH